MKALVTTNPEGHAGQSLALRICRPCRADLQPLISKRNSVRAVCKMAMAAEQCCEAIFWVFNTKIRHFHRKCHVQSHNKVRRHGLAEMI